MGDEIQSLLSEDKTYSAYLAVDGSKYCGWDKDNMNQLFYEKDKDTIQSIQLEIKYTGFRDAGSIGKTASALANTLKELTRPKSKREEVEISKIKYEKKAEKKYIFRDTTSDDKKLNDIMAKELKGLSKSMDREGQLQSIVLLKVKKHYEILCGYRRVLAKKQLGHMLIDANVYDDSDLTEQQRMRISVTENGERSDLNPVAIGKFLQSAHSKFKLTDEELAVEYGNILGIGTSDTTIQKYRGLTKLQTKSKDIMNGVIKGKVPIAVASDVLIPLKAEDRNCFYDQIIKQFRIPRANLIDIKGRLQELKGEGSLKTVISGEGVQDAIKEAKESENPNQELVKQIGLLVKDTDAKQMKMVDDTASTMRRKLMGKKATQKDFNITKHNGGEITLQIRLTSENYAVVLKNMEKLVGEEKVFRKILGADKS